MAASKKKSDSVPPPAQEEALVPVAAAPLARAHDYGDDMGAGYEDAGKGLVPFFSLFQSNSPQVEEKLVLGAAAGNLFNSATGELFDVEVQPGQNPAEKGLVIQPVYVKRAFVEWVKREKGGGVVGRYEPNDPHILAEIRRNGGSDIFSKENPMRGKVHAVDNTISDTRYLYFNLLSPDGTEIDGQGVIACTGSKIKPVDRLIQSLRNAKGQPALWAARVYLTSFQDKQKKPPHKVFKNIQFAVFGGQRFDINTLLDQDNDLYQAGRAFYQDVKGGAKTADFDKEASTVERESEDANENRNF